MGSIALCRPRQYFTPIRDFGRHDVLAGPPTQASHHKKTMNNVREIHPVQLDQVNSCEVGLLCVVWRFIGVSHLRALRDKRDALQ